MKTLLSQNSIDQCSKSSGFESIKLSTANQTITTVHLNQKIFVSFGLEKHHQFPSFLRHVHMQVEGLNLKRLLGSEWLKNFQEEHSIPEIFNGHLTWEMEKSKKSNNFRTV